ncbi:MAG: hypothetical protein IKR58_01325 [Lachnospiraceae bacterium]|nr:hypothetical protein [Lachnospiraceae bacterium]
MSKVKIIIIGVVVALVVLFGIIMLIPDDEEGGDDEGIATSEYDYEDEGDYGDEAYDEPKEEQSQQDAQTLSESDEVEAIPVNSDAKNATIMIYMNGSDLESSGGEATTDLGEMLSSGIGDKVNVVIQTMGTKDWQGYDISSKTAQTYCVKNGELKLVRDDLGQLDCTSEKTLSEFIGYCKQNYPAERYMFLFWDHGGGPVYGYGYDEWVKNEDASLTIAEMAKAFSEHKDIYFDMIGMDCCIMASLETCYALAPYCKYALLSEDFESGMGWSYTRWMKSIEENPGISTPLLGKTIIDDIIHDNESSKQGDSACMALFNMSTIENLFTAWKNYAYKNEEALGAKNYSKKHKAKGRDNRGFWDLWGSDESDVTLEDYYISDILALEESIDKDSNEAKKLTSTLKAAITYWGHTKDKDELTGMAITLPYGDDEFYDKLTDVYAEVGIDKEYINWLGGFVNSEGYDDYNDYSFFEELWNGWGDYEDDYGCNSSNGSCEYAYDYDSGDYYGHGNEEFSDNWIYDFEEDLWYMYEDGVLYFYDEETDTMSYYDEETDEIYYYDDAADDWRLMEE